MQLPLIHSHFQHLIDLLPSTRDGTQRAMDAVILAIGHGHPALNVPNETLQFLRQQMHEAMIYLEAAAEAFREFIQAPNPLNRPRHEEQPAPQQQEPHHGPGGDVPEEQEPAPEENVPERDEEPPAELEGNEKAKVPQPRHFTRLDRLLYLHRLRLQMMKNK